MGHFSGDFQYEIAITFQKSMEKGVRLEVFGHFGGLRSFLGCQYPDISHLLGPSYVVMFRWFFYSAMVTSRFVNKKAVCGAGLGPGNAL